MHHDALPGQILDLHPGLARGDYGHPFFPRQRFEAYLLQISRLYRGSTASRRLAPGASRRRQHPQQT